MGALPQPERAVEAGKGRLLAGSAVACVVAMPKCRPVLTPWAVPKRTVGTPGVTQAASVLAHSCGHSPPLARVPLAPAARYDAAVRLNAPVPTAADGADAVVTPLHACSTVQHERGVYESRAMRHQRPPCPTWRLAGNAGTRASAWRHVSKRWREIAIQQVLGCHR